MEWMQVAVRTSSEAVEAVANILMETGASGVAIEDAADFANIKAGKYGDHGEIVDPDSLKHIETGALVTAYFPESEQVEKQVPQITTRVLNLNQAGLNPGAAEVIAKPVNDTDWATAWEKYYYPVPVTRFLTVVPDWEKYTPKNNDERVIRLDPGRAFGTGTHPTTKLSLQGLESVIRGGETVIDVGTGSGVLTIGAELLGANVILATDLDDVAVDSAQKNLALNPEIGPVNVIANDLLNGINQTADIIVANILAEIIVPLVPQAWNNLPVNGYFVTSGIIDDKLDLVTNAMKQQGFAIRETLKMGEWYGVIAQRPDPTKE
ncbi:50S ribosomal protein L11 [Lentilactobacillus senioris DSM 24302 = JCM 17472]|uniref:Ribosomal protein L11 methyltransferase n=1 Tax=Lentilactobacillus senioris DSM 24302 = JCM 17472 TaxID=1423802 RepID=A0A0R2CQ46_9LACO|nr:50S ribosomal protein L11 methyltransferase [Lentilactobacillus senioris]KRM93768.1 50S ribosomal protein L11 [Lentilactobacillus senioris DSM 24302 = JCM 17472]